MAERQNGPSAAAQLGHYLPIVDWLPRYQRRWLGTDLLAGLTIWGTTVPTAMGYAHLVGLPVQAGLYAAMVALFAYAIFGTSPVLKVETSPSMAVMSAAVLAPIAAGDPNYYIALAAGLAVAVGVILIAAGLARMGFLADFLAKPVVAGFLFAIAIAIIINQLPKMFGLPAGSGSLLQQLVQFFTSLSDTNLWTLAISLATIVALWFFRRFLPRLPGSLIVIFLSILVVSIFDLQEYGVAVVGAIPTGVPNPELPHVQPSDFLYLFMGATAMVFVALGESVGTARTFADEHHTHIDPDQELVALGVANLGAGLMQGFSVGANPATTASSSAIRTKTQVASIVTALLLLLTVATRLSLISNLPEAVVAVAVTVSVSHLLDQRILSRFYRARRMDFYLALIALVGVLLAGLLEGLIIAVFISLLVILYRFSRPHLVVLGRMPDQWAYGDVARHAEAEQIPGILIARPSEPLFFTNAYSVHHKLRSLVASQPTPPETLIIDLRASADLDVATTDMLSELHQEMERAKVRLVLADAQSATRARLRHTGLLERIGEQNLFLSVEEAVTDLGRRTAPLDKSAEETEYET